MTPPPFPQESQKISQTPTIKAIFLGLFTLLLLIPLALIAYIVDERKDYAEESTTEISNKVGGVQNLLSPVLQVPYTHRELGDNNTYTYSKSYYWLLPERLDIKGKNDVSIRKRGIYETPIYTTKLQIEGAWNVASLVKLDSTLDWANAKIVLGLSDLKGLNSYVEMQVSGSTIKLASDNVREFWEMQPYLDGTNQATLGLLSAPYPIDSLQHMEMLSFSCPLNYSGSTALGFLPVGSETNVQLTSNWRTPSFVGSFLPDSSEMSKDGFDARWHIVEYNRGYGNILEEEDIYDKLATENFGVRLMQSVDQYTQTNRSIKYGILIIALTFLAIFFIELILRRQRKVISYFHYLLVGLALTLFYTLLLSLSEIIGFFGAYALASLMTVLLIGFYFHAILRNRRLSLVLSGIIIFLYLLVYILLQMTTYALLAGSLGLFAILAVIMYTTTKLIK